MSCSTPQNYAKTVDTWHGAPETALLQQWGHPTDVKHIHNGNHLDVYRVVERERAVHHYAVHATGARMSPQNSQALVMSHVSPMMRSRGGVFWCETTFEVNPMRLIVNAHFTGNNCDVTQHGMKRWSY